MAGLWVILTLVFVLKGGSAAVNQNQLAALIKGLKDEYQIQGMYSLAVSVPSEDPANLNQIFTDNPWRDVEQRVSDGFVYRHNRLTVAAVCLPEHAERRVLLNPPLQSNRNDLLVIYSYASPCNDKCTNRINPYNIITLIRNIINSGRWGRHVFVFEKIFRAQGSDLIAEDVLANALRDLGSSGIGLANIFRCFRPNNSYYYQCTSCSSGTDVTRDCVNYDA